MINVLLNLFCYSFMGDIGSCWVVSWPCVDTILIDIHQVDDSSITEDIV